MGFKEREVLTKKINQKVNKISALVCEWDGSNCVFGFEWGIVS